MRGNVSKYVVAALLGLAVLTGPLTVPTSAAPCPPGTEWDPITGTCILIDPD